MRPDRGFVRTVWPATAAVGHARSGGLPLAVHRKPGPLPGLPEVDECAGGEHLAGEVVRSHRLSDPIRIGRPRFDTPCGVDAMPIPGTTPGQRRPQRRIGCSRCADASVRLCVVEVRHGVQLAPFQQSAWTGSISMGTCRRCRSVVHVRLQVRRCRRRDSSGCWRSDRLRQRPRGRNVKSLRPTTPERVRTYLSVRFGPASRVPGRVGESGPARRSAGSPGFRYASPPPPARAEVGGGGDGYAHDGHRSGVATRPGAQSGASADRTGPRFTQRRLCSPGCTPRCCGCTRGG